MEFPLNDFLLLEINCCGKLKIDSSFLSKEDTTLHCWNFSGDSSKIVVFTILHSQPLCKNYTMKRSKERYCYIFYTTNYLMVIVVVGRCRLFIRKVKVSLKFTTKYFLWTTRLCGCLRNFWFIFIHHDLIRPIYIGKNQNPKKKLFFLLYRLHCQKNP